jgi:hypothetical protein
VATFPDPPNAAAPLTPEELARQRTLKRIVIGLGMAILLAFAAVVYGMVLRASRIGETERPSMAAGSLEPQAILKLPPGAHIRTMALDGNRLAVHFEAAGKPGIAIMDVKSGQVLSRIDIVTDGR